jgi:FkbM family methyltransferase
MELFSTPKRKFRMKRLLRTAGLRVNRAVARYPFAARAYLRFAGRITRLLPSKYLKDAIYFQMAAIPWPDLNLPAVDVEVAPHCSVKIVPHAQEFDFRAHFDTVLHYERPVFNWLSTRKYTNAIEIGANVGVYTVFLSVLVGPTGKVFAFEPSAEAFRRLLTNLSLNRTSNVQPFQCAIGASSGFVKFYEPEGHLTNGSLLPDFAAIFSDRISVRTSVAVQGALLEDLVTDGQILLKIDAEGAEEVILRAMESFIVRRRPDILLEVLPAFETGLNSLGFLRESGYKFFNLTKDGPIEQPLLTATDFRDYALIPL